MKNNLFIFFAPGLGGHHLANILSLTGSYEYTVDFTKYFDDVSKLNSQTAIAHNQIDHHAKTIYLYHFGDANDSKIKELIDQPNTQFLVIHHPKNNELALRRLEAWNKINLKNCPITLDIEKLYKPQILEKLYPSQWTTVMADELFNDFSLDQFFTKLENDLNVEILDKEFAKQVHVQWITNLRTALQQ
jgi:hypothetical protein